jgi:hypothetical protein
MKRKNSYPFKKRLLQEETNNEDMWLKVVMTAVGKSLKIFEGQGSRICWWIIVGSWALVIYENLIFQVIDPLRASSLSPTCLLPIWCYLPIFLVSHINNHSCMVEIA